MLCQYFCIYIQQILGLGPYLFKADKLLWRMGRMSDVCYLVGQSYVYIYKADGGNWRMNYVWYPVRIAANIIFDARIVRTMANIGIDVENVGNNNNRLLPRCRIPSVNLKMQWCTVLGSREKKSGGQGKSGKIRKKKCWKKLQWTEKKW